PVKQRYLDQTEHRTRADERDRGLQEARSLLEELQQKKNQAEVGDQLDRDQDDVELSGRDDHQRKAADDRIDDQRKTEQELRGRQVLRAAAMQGDIDEGGGQLPHDPPRRGIRNDIDLTFPRPARADASGERGRDNNPTPGDGKMREIRSEEHTSEL